MIELHIETDHLSFSDPRFSIPGDGRWEGWTDLIDAAKAQKLKELLENGYASSNGEKVDIPVVNLYADRSESYPDDTDAMTFESLSLPNFFTQHIYIDLTGSLGVARSRLSIRYCRGIGKYGPTDELAVDRRACALLDVEGGQVVHSLTYEQFKLSEAVDAYNRRAEEHPVTPESLFREFAVVRRFSESAGAILSGPLDRQVVSMPKTVKLSLERDENGLTIVPLMSDLGDESPINNDEFLKAFDRRKKVDGVYNLQDEQGRRNRIVLSANQKANLETVKRARTNGEDYLRSVVQNPEEHFSADETDFDYSELYSERVIDLGLYKPRVYPFVSSYESEWVPLIYIQDRISGDSTINLPDAESAEDLKRVLEQAKREGLQSVEYNGAFVPVEETLAALSKGSDEKVLDQGKPVSQGRSVLLIKENIERLEYRERFDQSTDLLELEPAPNLAADIALKKHQRQGVAWLQSLYKTENPGALLADDMGLGKTLQVLCFLEWASSFSELRTHLLVSPVSLLENWIAEYEKFLPNGCMYVADFTGGSGRAAEAVELARLSRHPSLVLLSYESLSRNQLELAKVDWGVVVLDEAQRIKTPGRIVTNAAKALKARFRVAMTGTPVENSFHDLWSIMDFCVPSLLGSARQFASSFQTKKGDSLEEIDQKGRALRDAIGPFILRRLKKDISDELPAKYDSLSSPDQFSPLNLERLMPSEQLDCYREQAVNAGSADRGNALHVIHRLRTVSEHPHALDDSYQELSVSRLIETSAKTSLLVQILNRCKSLGEKVIVFAELRKTQDIIARVVRSNYGLFPKIINGDSPARSTNRSQSRSRQDTVNEFNAGPGFDVLVMSPVAAGVGLNVTGANHVVHYGRHWNPAKEDQATDRAYRIGQHRDVYVYYPMATLPDADSFDIVLSRLIGRKRALAESSMYPSEMAEISPADMLHELAGG